MWIVWEDGQANRITLPELRASCPCATCADRRARHRESGGLHVIADEDAAVSADVREVRPVGRYAIQIVWGDGHDDGIYTYRLLREIASKAE